MSEPEVTIEEMVGVLKESLDMHEHEPELTNENLADMERSLFGRQAGAQSLIAALRKTREERNTLALAVQCHEEETKELREQLQQEKTGRDQAVEMMAQAEQRAEALQARVRELEEIVRGTPKAVFDELLPDCGETMAKAAAHAVKTLVR